MRYTEPGTVESDDGLSDVTTAVVDLGTIFGQAVLTLVHKEIVKPDSFPVILITTEDHWSGYSEYTVTNTWQEIVLSIPAWDWEKEWPSLGDFLRALADANPEREGGDS